MELREDARRVEPVVGGAYWDAMLDAIEAREATIAEHIEAVLPAFVPRLVRVVAVARRAGSTREEVEAAAAPLDRIHRMSLAHFVDPVGDWHDAHHGRRREARRLDLTAYPPVRPEHIEARRLARGTVRTDDLGETRARARLIQGGRVPEIERLGRLTDAELNLLLRRFGLQRNREALLSREVARVSRRLVGADNPDRELVDRVLDQAEAAVRRTLRVSAKAAVRDYHTTAAGWTADTVLEWEAHGAKSCPSCDARHGRKRTWAEWQIEGEPGSPNLICGPECNCAFSEV